tara:strand:+ start:48 stop:764 length:717 start_codon:yes stop_codon:yes gene_type:complete
MKYKVLALLLFASFFNEAYSQKKKPIPRFMWTPVVRPYKFLPEVDNSDPSQKTFDSAANTAAAHTMGTPYLVTEVGSVEIGGTQVSTVDTFWVYPQTSNHRAGLSAKKSFIIESKVMSRSYFDPTTNKSVFLAKIPNEHSSKSGVRVYNPYDKLLFSQIYGNYFVKPSVNSTNQMGANLNVAKDIFRTPLNITNLISTRNIKEVMKLGDYRLKLRMISRYNFLPESYLFRNSEGNLVQ